MQDNTLTHFITDTDDELLKQARERAVTGGKYCQE